MIKVVMDCFGGDHSPDANVEGALRALQEMNDLEIILTGNEKTLSTKLVGQKYDAKRLSIVHAQEVISCNEAPTLSVFHKKRVRSSKPSICSASTPPSMVWFL